ncbi:MAG: hypothetical protein J6T16_02910, partial [Opitutales bacterium]|nr:hypothetical protein [Opitutales bacterium]
MKKYFAVFAFAAFACAFAGGEEFSLEKRLDEEIAKNAGKDFAEKLPEGERLFYSQSSKSAFIIFSKDLAARNFGFALAGKAELAAEEMFGEVAAFQNPIEIHFLDEGEAKFEGNFLETSPFGPDIVLSVKYSKNLPLDEFFERLSRIYLRAYSLKCGAGANPPYWIELALRAMIAKQIADFAPIELARVLKQNPPDKILDVLKYSRESAGNIEKMEASAYFSLLAMRSAFGGNSQAWFDTLRHFLTSGAVGEDFMRARFGEGCGDKLWVGVYGEFYARLSGV